jgi:2-(1,2-epoxy-1,2-dihydrophenyl)acetyl-CoA isomerase
MDREEEGAIRYEVKAAVARLTLDRPRSRNAYSETMVGALIAALDAAAEDGAVRAVILTGAGSAFSAGGDLKQMQAQGGMFAGDSATLRRRYLEIIQGIPRRLARFDKPIIAAVNGPAMGAGLDLACMCDLRLAADTASFGSTFVRVGLIPGDGGAYILARTVGFPRALELILSGRTIDAGEALTVGLVHRVVPADLLLAEAHAWAEQLSALSPIALQLAKRAAYRSWDLPLDGALELAATYQGIAQHTADHHEAVAALLGRRAPVFNGR